MPKTETPDLVFSIDAGTGYKRRVYVTGQPEDYHVLVSDPVRPGALISIDKVDWERIVTRVKEQFE